MEIDADLDGVERLACRSITVLLGAAAAIDRDDPEGAREALGQLLRDDVGLDAVAHIEVLAAASMLTLDHLEAAVARRSGIGAGRPDPVELIDRAVGYGVAPRTSVLAAAWRLDAVRCGDHHRATQEVSMSWAAGDELDLLAGAAALLASTMADSRVSAPTRSSAAQVASGVALP